MSELMQQIPRSEHPRPQFVRENWKNLNGEWDFAFDFSVSKKEEGFAKKGCYDQKIIVPFCPESELSGIGFTNFIPAVWYHKTVSVSKEQLSGRVILHFGAVVIMQKYLSTAKQSVHTTAAMYLSALISPIRSKRAITRSQYMR